MAKGTRPDVSAASLSVNSLRAAPVVIVPYNLSVRNSTAPTSAVVKRVPDVNLRGAVLAVAVPAANVNKAVALDPVPILNARPEQYAIDEVPVTTRVTMNGNIRAIMGGPPYRQRIISGDTFG